MKIFIDINFEILKFFKKSKLYFRYRIFFIRDRYYFIIIIIKLNF